MIDKNKSLVTRQRITAWLSILIGLFLMACLPLTWAFRSPGSVNAAWYNCAFAVIVLVCLIIKAMKSLSITDVGGRLLIYIALAIGFCHRL